MAFELSPYLPLSVLNSFSTDHPNHNGHFRRNKFPQIPPILQLKFHEDVRTNVRMATRAGQDTVLMYASGTVLNLRESSRTSGRQSTMARWNCTTLGPTVVEHSPELCGSKLATAKRKPLVNFHPLGIERDYSTSMVSRGKPSERVQPSGTVHHLRGGPCFRPIVTILIASGLTLRITSRQSHHLLRFFCRALNCLPRLHGISAF